MSERLNQILQAPHLSEKSMFTKEKENVYVFRVLPDANKIEIKTAVEKHFEVQVTNVRTCTVRPRKRRLGKYVGGRLAHADWSCVIKTKTVEEQWNHFLTILFDETCKCSTKPNPESGGNHQPALAGLRGRLDERVPKAKSGVPEQPGDEIPALPVSGASEEGMDFTLTPVSLAELREVIQQIKVSSFPDVDGLTVDILKAVLDSADNPLLHIVNSSLRLAEVPPT